MSFLYPEQFSVFLYGLRFSDVNPAKTTFPETTRDFLEEKIIIDGILFMANASCLIFNLSLL